MTLTHEQSGTIKALEFAAHASDPTRTRTIRQAIIRDINRRFTKLIREIQKVVVEDDALGLLDTDSIRILETEGGYPNFRLIAPERTAQAFYEWWVEAYGLHVLGSTEMEWEGQWFAKYVRDMYLRGAKRAAVEMNKVGVDPIVTKNGVLLQTNAEEDELDSDELWYAMLPEEMALAGLIVSAEHARRIQSVVRVSVDALRGLTSREATEITNIIEEGIAAGMNPNEVARFITYRTSVTAARARTIARTEMIRAYHLAAILSYREAGIWGVRIIAEWKTAGDMRVCDECAALEGRMFTLDEIEPMIPMHPNCRCIALPIVQPE